MNLYELTRVDFPGGRKECGDCRATPDNTPTRVAPGRSDRRSTSRKSGPASSEVYCPSLRRQRVPDSVLDRVVVKTTKDNQFRQCPGNPGTLRTAS